MDNNFNNENDISNINNLNNNVENTMLVQDSIQNLNQNNNGKNNNKKIIIIALIIILLAVVILFGFKYFSSKNMSDNEQDRVANKKENTENSEETEEADKTVGINREDEKLVSITKSVKVNFKIYTTEEGGRNTSIYSGYSPTFDFNGEKFRGSLLFPDNIEKVEPGEYVEATLIFTTASDIKDAKNFFILEENKKVGEGSISSVLISSSMYVGKNGYKRVDPSNKEANRTYDANGDLLLYADTRFSSDKKASLLGDVTRGTIRLGDAIQILGRDGIVINTEVAGLELYRKNLESATINERISVGLKDIPYEVLTDYMMIYKPGTISASNTAVVNFRYMDNDVTSSISLKEGDEVKVAIGRNSNNKGGMYSTGKIISSSTDNIKKGDVAKVMIRLDDVVSMEKGMSVYLIMDSYKEVAKGEIKEF